MSWYDEQLRYRIKKDDASFSESLTDIAGAILGKKLIDALDDTAVMKSAVEEVLKFYHFKPKIEEIPNTLTDLDKAKTGIDGL